MNEYHKVKRLLYFNSFTEEEQLTKRRLLVIANFLRLRTTGPAQKYVLDIASNDIDPNNRGIKILRSCCLYSGLTNLIFLSNGTILRYDRRINIRGEYYWRVTEEYSGLLRGRADPKSYKLVRLMHSNSDIFCCYEYKTSNSSNGRNQGITNRDARTLVCTLLGNLENNENCKQPTQLTRTFAITSGNIGSRVIRSQSLMGL